MIYHEYVYHSLGKLKEKIDSNRGKASNPRVLFEIIWLNKKLV